MRLQVRPPPAGRLPEQPTAVTYRAVARLAARVAGWAMVAGAKGRRREGETGGGQGRGGEQRSQGLMPMITPVPVRGWTGGVAGPRADSGISSLVSSRRGFGPDVVPKKFHSLRWPTRIQRWWPETRITTRCQLRGLLRTGAAGLVVNLAGPLGAGKTTLLDELDETVIRRDGAGASGHGVIIQQENFPRTHAL